jgi:RNA polymerase sigma-70 factor (ECF subfamily)
MKRLAAKRALVKSLPAHAEENELGLGLARGDERAFERVVERYGRRVTALAARLLGYSEGADDVAQDVFLAVLRKRTHFRGDAKLWTWLAAITVNRCRSLRRRQWIWQRVLRAAAPLRPRQTAPADRASETHETAAQVRAAVARLPAAYREAIVLRYLEELTVDEVAEVLSLRRNTVEVRLSRGRKLLEESLGDLS